MVLRLKCAGILSLHHGFRSKRAVVGENQLDSAPGTERAINLKSVDCGEITRFESQTIIIKLSKRRVIDCRSVKHIQVGIGLDDSRRLIFKPGLVGGNFESLSGPHAAEVL